jgi:hypothetical protein
MHDQTLLSSPSSNLDDLVLREDCAVESVLWGSKKEVTGTIIMISKQQTRNSRRPLRQATYLQRDDLGRCAVNVVAKNEIRLDVVFEGQVMSVCWGESWDGSKEESEKFSQD